MGLFSLIIAKSGATAAKAVLPAAMVTSLKRQRSRGWLGSLARVTPISRNFGFDRGTPIDRYYIEQFLGRHASDVRGRVLEFGDDAYTKRFGGGRVTQSDVLHAKPGNSAATIVADLADAPQIADDTFDCVICTQTLMFVYDVKAAVQTIHRILKPGGVVLCTVAGISQICRWDMDQWGDYWRFNSLSVRRLFESAFGPRSVDVHGYGNVLTAVAFLHGLAQEDLTRAELDYADRDYELLLTLRAVKRPLA